MQRLPSGVSVVICCHNSAVRLPATLAHLRAQKVSPGLPWEVIIVDNASNDDTARVAEECWQKRPDVPLRIIGEPRRGLAFARERGAATARYEFVSFVDDDNWVADDWIEQAATFMREHPDVGAVGGCSTAAFEKEPACWFRDCQVMYAITPENWSGGECADGRCPWGAGLTMRIAAWQDVDPVGTPFLTTGRHGKSLAGGEDSELCYRLQLAGWKLWYEPRLRFQHYMPQGRLTWDYARRLYRGSGAASAALLPYRILLNPPLNRAFESLRQRWAWQLVVTVKGLLSRPWKLVQAAAAPCEADPEILHIEELLGSLTALLRNRSSYSRRAAELKQLAGQLHSRPRAERKESVLVELNGGAKIVQ